MTDREQEILGLVRDNPLISQKSLADRLGISRSAVAGHIMNLTAKGLIKGRGYVLTEAPFVAVIGGANVDIHGSPGRPLRLGDSNPGSVRTSPGGVARNVAENLARLGVDTRLVTPLGNDHHGDMLERLGREAGMDMRHSYRVAGAQTSTYIAVLDDTGDMYVAISDMDILDTLDAQRLRPLEPMLRQASAIVLDTNLRDDALAWLTSTFADKPLFVDTVSIAKAVRISPYLSCIHTLKPSLAEAEAIAGISAATPSRLPGLAAWFHDRGVERLFVSLGDGGVFHSTSHGCGLEPAMPVKGSMRNASGAGDALLAGLVYGWTREWSLPDSLRFGMAAARLTLAHPSTINPDMSVAAVRRLGELEHAS